MEAMAGLPLTVGDYLRELVARLRTALGDELLGVYAGGSFALGGFDQYLSDLDVAAVTATHAGRPTKQAIVELLRHESLPCPARGLEFVLYAEPVIHTATTDPGFELNLNSGARMSFRADYEPGEERHWFAIDRSVLAAHGLPLFGPPAGELFAPIPRGALLEVVAEAVQWHRETHVVGSDAVLNACRALRFADDGVWSSKIAAGGLGARATRSASARRAGARSAAERRIARGARRAPISRGSRAQRATGSGCETVGPGTTMNGFGEQVRIVSSLTRSGSSIGQSESIVNAIRMRLEDAGHRVSGVPVVYEDLDGGSEERGSWDAEREQANARYAAAQADVLAYIGTLDTDAAPYSIPITNAADLLMVSPCNTYPGLTRPFEPGEPDKHYPTGRRNYLRTALSDDLQGAVRSAMGGRARRAAGVRPARHRTVRSRRRVAVCRRMPATRRRARRAAARDRAEEVRIRGACSSDRGERRRSRLLRRDHPERSRAAVA